MSSFFEEFGFTLVAAICATIVVGLLMSGLDAGGTFRDFIISLTQTHTGG